MTLQDFFNSISSHPTLLVLLLLAVPLLTFLVNLWSGNTAQEVLKWRYVYSALAYLACVPGIFAVTLNIYLFLFERQSIWTMNLGTQLLPIVTMVATLMLIKRQIPFDFVPAFGKLSGFMTLITAAMGIMWFIDRTRIYAITFVPFSYIAIGFLVLLVVIRFAWSKIF
jgi:preprotein translocase subunit Sec61beta